MHIFIMLLLAAIAIYCGGMWLWMAWVAIKDRDRFSRGDVIDFERQTFHLGLCLILALMAIGLFDRSAC